MRHAGGVSDDGQQGTELESPTCRHTGGLGPVRPLLASLALQARPLLCARIGEDRYSPIGRPSIDPVVFFGAIRSERLLMEVLADRISIR